MEVLEEGKDIVKIKLEIGSPYKRIYPIKYLPAYFKIEGEIDQPVIIDYLFGKVSPEKFENFFR